MLARPWLLLCFGIASCARESGREDAAVVQPPSTTAAAFGSTGSAGPACPSTGRWARCSVVERLERAGLAPQLDSAPASEPPLSVSGFTLRVGNAELEIYLFGDAAAREREVSLMDTARYLPYTDAVSIQRLPTLIQSANLIAILHSRNDHQRERVGDAITAGPPQPSSP